MCIRHTTTFICGHVFATTTSCSGNCLIPEQAIAILPAKLAETSCLQCVQKMQKARLERVLAKIDVTLEEVSRLLGRAQRDSGYIQREVESILAWVNLLERRRDNRNGGIYDELKCVIKNTREYAGDLESGQFVGSFPLWCKTKRESGLEGYFMQERKGQGYGKMYDEAWERLLAPKAPRDGFSEEFVPIVD
ncbi:hypothetical protein L873DRAFT_41950 [Choiromyces venosus 120613-1]|uniref:Uncharacterized protein n=1 Tax=Choiromyces venosus 120613-1 TaxID=1336337 RepID=A0A3N4K6D1_9PEZI|nr:hypothetical protein L873DRAFT_41950 [Choiromyces venosus 120613-1]